MTIQEIAQEIDKLKPDLKPFWEEINQDNKYYAKYVFTPTGNHFIDLFEIELIRLYYGMHNQRYLGSTLETSINNALQTIPYTVPKVSYRRWTLESDIANKTSNYYNLISSHVTDLKQYLNPYLKKKFGLVGAGTKPIKQLQDNEFSVELFKNSLGKRKLPSTEVSMYFKQFKDFSQPIRDKFMEVVFNHCTAPSRKLQVELEDSGVFNVRTTSGSKYISVSRRTARFKLNTNSLPIPDDLHNERTTSGSKYISVSRRTARWKLNTSSLPIPDDLHNERDSDYTPFTCGVPRKPTPTKEEVSALIGIMLIVECSDLADKDYIVSCLKEHLAHPDYETIYTDQIKALRNYASTITELTKDI